MRGSILISTLALGCSHYGWADRSDSSTATGVSVQTISVPADRGVDADALTLRLVGSLQRAGWAGARWSNDRLEHGVQCSIDDFRDHGFGRAIEISATISCTLGPDSNGVTIQRRVNDSSWLRTDRLPSDLKKAYQEVSMTAVESIVFDLATALEMENNHGQT